METKDLQVLQHSADRARDFYKRLQQRVLAQNPQHRVILVTHLLPDRPAFLEALSRQTQIVAIIPKPRSVYGPIKAFVEQHYPVLAVSRITLAQNACANAIFAKYSDGKPTAIIDIGGYFAPAINAVHAANPGLLLGVVEDTENGQQKYERISNLSTPVFSVARSPLKEAEDDLIGESIVFSTERIIRSCGEIMCGRRAVVFGYGKVGRSISRSLIARGVRVSVVDTNPVRAVEAAAHGYRILGKRAALASCELIFGATGNFSLASDDFGYVRNGAFIASVTSSDDELELDWLSEVYESKIVTDAARCFSKEDRYFYLLNEGNAVNFPDGAVVGSFIHLVHAEILASLSMLQGPRRVEPGLQAITSTMRQQIAEIWLEVFNNESHGTLSAWACCPIETRG